MNLPSWVDDPQLDEEERARRLIKYHLRRAALWNNPDASITKLATGLGVSASVIHNGVSRGTLSRKLALAIEAFVDGVVTRDQLAPKHFITSEA